MATLPPIGTQVLRVLIVEDNPGDARLLRAQLNECALLRCEVTHTETLSGIADSIAAHAIDLIILDLELPDSSGIGTVQDVRVRFPHVALVVLTGNEDPAVASDALRVGAQDYLIKGQADTPLLERTIRYGLERHRLLERIDAMRFAEQREHELGSLARLATPPATQVTAQLFGARPLREGFPAEFSALRARYEETLDLALEQKTFQVEHPITKELRDIAERLTTLRSGPRDVIELHTSAVQTKTASAAPARARAIVEEGRITVLELMGHLASMYRVLSYGNPNATNHANGSKAMNNV